MISFFETLTQHILGQPFCNMSMEVLEMIVKHAKDVLFCRPAKSGEVKDPNWAARFVAGNGVTLRGGYGGYFGVERSEQNEVVTCSISKRGMDLPHNAWPSVDIHSCAL